MNPYRYIKDLFTSKIAENKARIADRENIKRRFAETEAHDDLIKLSDYRAAVKPFLEDDIQEIWTIFEQVLGQDHRCYSLEKANPVDAYMAAGDDGSGHALYWEKSVLVKTLALAAEYYICKKLNYLKRDLPTKGMIDLTILRAMLDVVPQEKNRFFALSSYVPKIRLENLYIDHGILEQATLFDIHKSYGGEITKIIRDLYKLGLLAISFVDGHKNELEEFLQGKNENPVYLSIGRSTFYKLAKIYDLDLENLTFCLAGIKLHARKLDAIFTCDGPNFDAFLHYAGDDKLYVVPAQKIGDWLKARNLTNSISLTCDMPLPEVATGEIVYPLNRIVQIICQAALTEGKDKISADEAQKAILSAYQDAVPEIAFCQQCLNAVVAQMPISQQPHPALSESKNSARSLLLWSETEYVYGVLSNSKDPFQKMVSAVGTSFLPNALRDYLSSNLGIGYCEKADGHIVNDCYANADGTNYPIYYPLNVFKEAVDMAVKSYLTENGLSAMDNEVTALSKAVFDVISKENDHGWRLDENELFPVFSAQVINVETNYSISNDTVTISSRRPDQLQIPS